MGADRGLLWVAAMETGSWDVWLRYSSCADDTSPTDSARNARTPAEKERKDMMTYNIILAFSACVSVLTTILVHKTR